MCGDKADSAEHKIKRADLIRQFGGGPYKGDNALLHSRQDRLTPMQGPSSPLVKFEKTLCIPCNTTRSQPFDRAYDAFVGWNLSNEAVVCKRRVLDFEEVYGEGWEDYQRNLFKFFAKNLGCRLVDAGRPVPRDVVDLLTQHTFRTAFYVTFQVNGDQLLLPADIQTIGIDPLITHKQRATGEEVGYQCGLHFHWLRMLYWYNHFPLEPIGSP